MAQIRRPPRNQQRVTLVRLFLALSGILFLTIFLFNNDGFPRKNALRQKNIQPVLTPEKLLAQEFIRQRTVDAVAATEEGSRRFEFHLAGLKDGAKGTVVIETRPSWAPIGVAHFHTLMDAKFYNECRFFRVIPNFMVQFGIAADPEVQKHWRQDVLKDDPVKQTNARGAVTFATSGADSRTTQLFINTKPAGNAFLDKQGFAPFAVVLEGMNFVDQIYDDYREKPNQQKIVNQGNVYLNKEFPLLSYIESAEEVTVLQGKANGEAPVAQER